MIKKLKAFIKEYYPLNGRWMLVARHFPTLPTEIRIEEYKNGTKRSKYLGTVEMPIVDLKQRIVGFFDV